MKPGVLAVIPARMQSSRFPGKALYPINGRPLLYHVWNAVRRCTTIDNVVIASDSDDILTAAQKFGADIFRSSSKPKTGCDRVAEVARKVTANIYMNVQGDCFGISPASVDKLVSQALRNKKIMFGTLAYRIEDDTALDSPNLVKVVLSRDNRALWFSRCPIPFVQNTNAAGTSKAIPRYGHIGVYLFRRSSILQYGSWKRTPCEVAESLEQLRILEHGGTMHVCLVRQRPQSIDSPEDAKKVELRFRKAG